MNPLECEACGATAPANAHHCDNCGGADFRALPLQQTPPPPPVATAPTRDKRNR